MRHYLLVLSAVGTLTLSGCFLPPIGPDFEMPDTATPERLAALDAVTTNSAEMLTITPATAWWGSFGDPVLDELVSRALANNKDLLAAKERIFAARTQNSAVASLYPTVDGSVKRDRRRDEVGGDGGPSIVSRQNSYYAGAGAAWELDFWGKNRRAVEAADQETLAAEADYRRTVLMLVSETAAAYFEVLGARENLQLIEDEIENRGEFLTLVKTREDNGMASRLDTRRQEVEDSQIRAQRPDAQARLARAHYALATLLGEDPQVFALPERTLAKYPELPLVPEALPMAIVRQRPDVLQAEASMRAASARIGVAMGALLPSVSISGDAGYRAGDFDDWFDSESREWGIGVGANIPIYDHGVRATDVEVRRSQFRESVARYQQSVLVSLQEINAALITAAKGRERRVALIQALEAARDAERIGAEQYRSGLIDLLDYLDLQRVELNARNALIDTDLRVVQDMVALYRALGGGWEADVVDDVAGPTPKHFLENFPLFSLGLEPRTGPLDEYREKKKASSSVPATPSR